MRHPASAEPHFWDWCEYCGGPICLGEIYYEYDGMRVCTECARECAWAAFLDAGEARTAQAAR